MTTSATLGGINRVDEPQAVKDYSNLLNEVASKHQPVIISRGGNDLAALIPIEQFELLRDALAREEAERISANLDWDQLVRANPPPQAYFDGDEPKPF